jgi:integrase
VAESVRRCDLDHRQIRCVRIAHSSRECGPIGVWNSRSWWKPAVLAVGLSGLKFHELRHTFVALWIAAGANPKEVSVRAGHSSVAFTLDRYGHLYEGLQDEIPDRLDTPLSVQLASQTRPK